MGSLKDPRAEAAERAALLPVPSSAATVGPAAKRGRHELPLELAELITAAMPASTRAEWLSRFENGFRRWAEERYETVMPPTDEILAAYMHFLLSRASSLASSLLEL